MKGWTRGVAGIEADMGTRSGGVEAKKKKEKKSEKHYLFDK